MRDAIRVVILCALAAVVAAAQESPFVPPETYRSSGILKQFVNVLTMDASLG